MDPIHLTLSQMATVSLDNSFFIQLALVIALGFVLNALIFQPFLASMEAREKKTGETQRTAAELQARAASIEQKYKDDIAAARDAAFADRQAVRADASAHRDAVISAARDQASETLAGARASIDAEFEDARTALLGQVDDLSGMIVDKVLGRGV